MSAPETQSSAEPASESRVKAASVDALTPTGTHEVDHLTYDAPKRASLAALFAAALAPWETVEPIAFATDALKQLAAEICVLEDALFNAGEAGPMDEAIARRVMVGIETRARVAAEVLNRLVAARKAVQP